MTSIAASLTSVFRLDAGAIIEHPLATASIPAPYAGPEEVPVQLACSRMTLFARTVTGSAYSRPLAAGGRWGALAVPYATSWLSVGDTHVYALAGSVRKKPLAAGGFFGRNTQPPRFTTFVQIDNDERDLYALTDDGRILVTYRGGWHEYPALANAVEIAASLKNLYVRTSFGDVYRSHTHADGGWQRLGINDALAMTIAPDHDDTLYVATAGGFRTVSPLEWPSDLDRAWIEAGYISEDWIVVEAA